MDNMSQSFDLLVDDRLECIRDGMNSSVDCDTTQPGYKQLYATLSDYLDPSTETNKQDFLRGILQAYKEVKDDDGYQQIEKKLTETEQACLDAFVGGASIEDAGADFELQHSFGVRDELQHFQDNTTSLESPAQRVPYTRAHDSVTEVQGVSAQAEASDAGPPCSTVISDTELKELGDSVKAYVNVKFDNWGRTVNFIPKYTFWPRDVIGVQNIVKFAKQRNLSVRCAGYRHSWSPIFGSEGQVLLSTMDPEIVSRLPDTTSLPVFKPTPPTELESIDVLTSSKLPVTEGKTLVRVGTACTNERLRRWCVENNKLTLPLNVIMVELTLGGSNAPICHGAGLQHSTLSDLVRCIEYVDCNGKLQTITDPRQLRAASGAFGLLGVVTHITLEFDPMSYALLKPRKVDLVQAIPPPDDLMDKLPKVLKKTKRTPEQRQRDIAAFELACASSYYAEWFWFPYCDQAWVNTWNVTDDPAGVRDFPDNVATCEQWLGTVLMNVTQNSKFLKNLGKLIGFDATGTTIISRAAMFMLGDKDVKTYVTDGLHFQRAIQNVRVRDIEAEIPIPAVKTAGNAEPSANWELVRRAWWDAIFVAYDNYKTQPQRMPLEMRITGGSNVIMAPQKGNTFGTCSIEVLTLENQQDAWISYRQQVLDRWTSYKDADGKPLNVRPHWAKEWYDLKVGGRLWRDMLKEQYARDVKEFREVLAGLGKEQGWELADLKQRFGNEWLNDFFLSLV